VPTGFGRVDNFVTRAGSFGEQVEHWNGVDVTLNARLPHGLAVQGGISSGRTTTDNCAVISLLPEALFGAASLGTGNAGSWLPAQYCHLESPFLSQVKALGAYTIPKIDVQFSGTFQSKPGPQLAANFNVSSAVAAASLGRPLSGGAANVTVNLVEPGALYGDRVNQLDFRVAKILRIGRTRSQVGFDLYNALNSSAVQTYNQTFGARWLTPTLVLPARFAKVSVQFDF